MRYRKLGRTGWDVSEVGLGLEHLEKADKTTVDRVLSCLIDAGGNYIDLFMGSPDIRDFVGASLRGRRDRVLIQGHLGACWRDGQYLRTRDRALCRTFADDLLRRLDTDFLDVLMIHFVDDADEWDRLLAPGGIMELARAYVEAGHARAIGLSSHVPSVARRAVESGLLDVLMYPVNPLFDSIRGDRDIDALFHFDAFEAHGRGADRDRTALYDACERHGTAIVTMKTYAAGWLLGEHNQLRLKMTPAQCIQYALDQPGVAAALPGCRSVAEMEAALSYTGATPQERDYARALAGSLIWDRNDHCMYCNHCLPCPAGIDIGETTRILDRSESPRSGFDPDALRGAYAALPAPAGACTACGACESRCPFDIGVIDNMRRAAALFEG